MTKHINTFFEEYFSIIKKNLDLVDVFQLKRIADVILQSHFNKGKVIIVGNGGSASIASHLTVDFINAAKIKAVNFNEPGIITCFSNDYGYENWVSKALECYANKEDTVILISSSGQSKNMLIAADKAKSIGTTIVTLSGFSSDNNLRKLGCINLWVDSKVYNIVEMTHHIWLLAAIDYIIESNKDGQV